MATDPHSWPSAAFDPAGRIARLEHDLTVARIDRDTYAIRAADAERRAEVAEAAAAQLDHAVCHLALHEGATDGRVGKWALWRALLGLAVPGVA